MWCCFKVVSKCSLEMTKYNHTLPLINFIFTILSRYKILRTTRSLKWFNYMWLNNLKTNLMAVCYREKSDSMFLNMFYISSCPEGIYTTHTTCILSGILDIDLCRGSWKKKHGGLTPCFFQLPRHSDCFPGHFSPSKKKKKDLLSNTICSNISKKKLCLETICMIDTYISGKCLK